MQAWLANAIYYPTLAYNVLLGRVLRWRHWWDDIEPHLMLGARPLPGDPERLKKLGVTGVINMCREMQGPVGEYERLGIEQLWLPTVDFNHPSREHVEQGAEFIEQHRRTGGRVYVHCKAGRARSATVVLWWLVKYGHMTPEQAQAHLLKCRPHTNPHIDQRPVIEDLYRAWQAQQ